MEKLINKDLPGFNTLIGVEINTKYTETIKVSKSHQDDIQSFLANQLPQNAKFKVRFLFEDGVCEADCSNIKFNVNQVRDKINGLQPISTS